MKIILNILMHSLHPPSPLIEKSSYKGKFKFPSRRVETKSPNTLFKISRQRKEANDQRNTPAHTCPPLQIFKRGKIRRSAQIPPASPPPPPLAPPLTPLLLGGMPTKFQKINVSNFFHIYVCNSNFYEDSKKKKNFYWTNMF